MHFVFCIVASVAMSAQYLMVVSNFLLHYLLFLMLADKLNMLDFYKFCLVTYTAVAQLAETLLY